MKKFTQMACESITAKSWEKKTDKSEITIDDIKGAVSGASFMDDRAWANVDNSSFEKIGKNKWQRHSNSAHALCGTINDKEMLDIIQASKEFKLMLPVV